MSVFYGTTIRPGAGEPLVVAEEGWDSRQGRTLTYEWRGREDEIRAMQSIQEGLRRKTNLRIPAFEGGEFILQATTGAGESDDKEQPIATKWTLKKQFIEKNLWESQSITKILDPLLAAAPIQVPDGESDVRKIVSNMKRDFEAFIRGDEKYTTVSGKEEDLTSQVIFGYLIILNIGSVENQNVFSEFLKARLKGVETLVEWGYVLTKSVTFAEGTTQRPNKENVGRMFSRAALVSAENLNDEVIIGELPDGFWLKTPCEVDQTGADKHDFSYEYWHANTFEKFIYGEAI